MSMVVSRDHARTPYGPGVVFTLLVNHQRPAVYGAAKLHYPGRVKSQPGISIQTTTLEASLLNRLASGASLDHRMAAVQIVTAVDIPGIHHAPTAQDCAECRNVSNSLPQPEDQPEISDTALMSLGELFVRHGAHDAFGIHLLHAHFQIPVDTALCGAQVKISDNSESCWTKPLLAKELATRTKPRLNSLSGHRAL
ncbi:hypothetical protein MAC_02865 [Metarhizium acridum CQMa 102]|uniref:Uncharacterized protein n=1 Tax=Metarhizium acridum (strain CQMa 102) TaxID=655827 RepID=E9DZ17_METAQ|nr:uncharacterized protein MAC_02865 [Metarhizium acridum CQMa 102]EFY91194.1 hypothetical protein MAC_02865 [Metarhizium acridum CQMa 102]